jgi:hypothetical protein
MIKQEMTEVRKARILKSVTMMAVMAEVIKMEYIQDMDTRFKNPLVNNFANRIRQDAEAIQIHLKTNQNVNIKFLDQNFVEEYAAELHRVFHFFVGIPLSQIKDIMDQLYEQSEQIEEMA